MKYIKVLVLIFVLVIVSGALAVETWHIGGTVGGTIYVKWDADVFTGGDWSNPTLNSPLHESWNLVDELVGGNPNPFYLGDGSTYPDGFYGKCIMYNKGELHIDSGAKVGFGHTIWSGGHGGHGGNETGKILVTGELIVENLRHWKGGGTSWHEVTGNGILTVNNWHIGIVDNGDNIVHGLIADNALVTVENLTFETAGSDLTITGGELLVGNMTEQEVQNLIGTSILGSNLVVTTKGNYTSVTPEPATIMLLALGTAGLIGKRRQKIIA